MRRSELDNPLACTEELGIGQMCESIKAILFHSRECHWQCVEVRNSDGAKLQAERGTNRLNVFPKETMQRITGILKHSDPADSCHGLGQYFHPFARKLGAVHRNSGDVATRTGEARHETRAQRIGGGSPAE